MNTLDYIIKKYGIIVGHQYIIDIPNMGRNQLAQLFAELDFRGGAEIGVDQGLYSEVLCKANPNLHLYGVDPWKVEAYEPGIAGITDDPIWFESDYQQAKTRLASYPNCTIVRKTSAEALKDFKDNSLDFVYIDANHDFPNFIFDLHNWSKKVKVGGIVSGHDYAIYSYKKHNHVKRALEAYARSYRMIPLFIVGSMEVIPGQIRDRYRSWFWVKSPQLMFNVKGEII
jgi:hypothetical protein